MTETLPSFLCTVVPMIALAKMWKTSVPTARMPLTPAAISAGRDDEAAAGADAAGDQAGREADRDRHQEDRGRVVRRRVGGLAADQVGRAQRRDRQDRRHQRQQPQHLLPVLDDAHGDLVVPLRVGHRGRHEELVELPRSAHDLPCLLRVHGCSLFVASCSYLIRSNSVSSLKRSPISTILPYASGWSSAPISSRCTASAGRPRPAPRIAASRASAARSRRSGAS